MILDEINNYAANYDLQRIELEFLAYKMVSESSNNKDDKFQSSNPYYNKIVMGNLIWVIYYLNAVKEIPMSEIHSFFVFKKWTSYKYENFRKNYRDFKKDQKFINMKNSIDSINGGAVNVITPLNKESNKTVAAEIVDNKFDAHTELNKDGINIHSSAEENRERLRSMREDIAKKRLDKEANNTQSN